MKKILAFTLAAAILMLAPAAHAQWAPLLAPGPYQLTDITFPDSATGFATGYNPDTQVGVVFRTHDAGATWQQTQTADRSYQLSFPSTTQGFLVSGIGEVQKTSDGGANWQNLSGVGGNIGGIHFHDSLNGILAGWYLGFISTTSDGGQTWQSTSTQNVSALHFPTPQVGYAIGDGLMRTLDGGLIWDTLSDFTYGRTLFFTSATTGFYANTVAQIARTSDSGQSWDFWEDGMGSFIGMNDIYFPDSLTGFAVGGFGTILKTTDGGVTWTQSPSGTTQDLRSVYCTNANTCYISGDSSTILKTTTGGVLAAAENIQQPKALQLYPNPTNGSVTLQLEQLAGTTPAVLQLHDLAGKVVLERKLPATTANHHQVQLQKLPAGIYTARVVATNAVYTAKLVLQ